MGQPLSVLLVHEHYVHFGGEDVSVEADAAMLTRQGHRIIRWNVSNSEIPKWPLSRRASLLWETTWSTASRRTLRAILREERPDVVHFHNTLPIISPASIRLAHECGFPVVMTLHNYRLLCPVGTFVRDGRLCEACVESSLLRGVVHGCYRGSRIQTGAVAMMLAAHRLLGTWTDCVDAYIALTPFMRTKLSDGGLPAARIMVHGNFLPRSPVFTGKSGDYVLFAGRLSPEKGVDVLLGAVQEMKGIRVRLVGEGPLKALALEVASKFPDRLEVTGALPRSDTLIAIGQARALVLPSIWFEGFPWVILEAFSAGVPVVASRIGSLEEIVTDGVVGLLAKPGQSADLADKIRMLALNPDLRQRLGMAARRVFEKCYTEESGYASLVSIYKTAIENHRARCRKDQTILADSQPTSRT